MVLHLFSQGAILTDPINGSDHLGVRYSFMHQVLQVKGKPFIWTPRQSHRHTGEGECVACPVSERGAVSCACRRIGIKLTLCV